MKETKACRRFKARRIGAGVMLIAVGALLLALRWGPEASAQDFILHPAYIHGTVTLPDALEPGGAHVIGRLQVSAVGKDAAGNTYSAGCTVEGINTTVATFDLTVEGTAPNYNVQIVVGYGPPYLQGSTWCYHRQIIFSTAAAVAIGQTAQVLCCTDAWIDISASVAGEFISAIDVTASWEQWGSYTGKIYSNVTAFQPQVRIPVGGRVQADYIVTCNARLGDNGSIGFPARSNLGVPAAACVPVSFDVVPGYLEGLVTVIGAGLTSGSVSAQHFNPETGQNLPGVGAGRIAVTGTGSGTYRVPCFPGDTRSSYNLQTTKGSYTPVRTGMIVAGETTVCDVELNLNASVAVTVDVPNVADISGALLVGSQRINFSAPGRYVFDGLAPGNWEFNGEINAGCPMYPQDLVSATRQYRYHPPETIEVGPGQHIELDKSFVAGFLRGSVFSPNCAVLSELQRIAVAAQELDRVGGYVQTSAGKLDPATEGSVLNLFELFMAPGARWTVTYTDALFMHPLPDGSHCTPRLAISDWKLGAPSPVYNLPQVAVASGQTVAGYALDYKLGQITAQLRVADGSPFSKPAVTGNYWVDLTGSASRTVFLFGGLDVVDVTEASVLLYAIPGVYQLTAKATVGESSTQFGAPFFVTVDAGDIVEKDPDGPDLVVSFPPGEHVTCDAVVDVTGTVTDASGISHSSLNGEPIVLQPGGGFERPDFPLVLGNNILHFEAVDSFGKVTTVDRIVIRDGLPVAIDDCYEMLDDEVLNTPAPGVLANDTDPENDPLVVTAWTAPASGTLAMAPNGAFTYAPASGVKGTYAFSYTVGDGKCGGNTATVTIDVKLRNQPPAALCQDVSVSVGPDCQADVSVDAGSYDPDAGDAITLVQSPAGPYSLGTTEVTLTVTDSHGLSAACSAVVTVVDAEDPTIIAPVDLFVASDSGDCSGATVVLGEPMVADNCGVVGVVNDHPSPTFPLGETLVTWVVTDTSGRTASAVQKVTVLKSVTLPVQPPLAPEPVANKVRRGQVVPHKVAVTDCSGFSPTTGITVRLKVQGIDSADNSVFQDVLEEANGEGSDGTVTADGIMQWVGGVYQFNLDTSNFSDPNTLGSPRFYRSTITVMDDATLTVLGTVSVILETRD